MLAHNVGQLYSPTLLMDLDSRQHLRMSANYNIKNNYFNIIQHFFINSCKSDLLFLNLSLNIYWPTCGFGSVLVTNLFKKKKISARNNNFISHS